MPQESMRWRPERPGGDPFLLKASSRLLNPGGNVKNEPDLSDFCMNTPVLGSRGAAACMGNFSRIYISKQNPVQALAPVAAWAETRPHSHRCHLSGGQKALARCPQAAQPGTAGPLLGGSPKPHQSALRQTAPSLMNVVPNSMP